MANAQPLKTWRKSFSTDQGPGSFTLAVYATEVQWQVADPRARGYSQPCSYSEFLSGYLDEDVCRNMSPTILAQAQALVRQRIYEQEQQARQAARGTLLVQWQAQFVLDAQSGTATLQLYTHNACLLVVQHPLGDETIDMTHADLAQGSFATRVQQLMGMALWQAAVAVLQARALQQQTEENVIRERALQASLAQADKSKPIKEWRALLGTSAYEQSYFDLLIYHDRVEVWEYINRHDCGGASDSLTDFLYGKVDAVVRQHLGDAVLQEAKDIVRRLLAQ